MMPFLEWSLPHNLWWRWLQPIGGYTRYPYVYAVRGRLSCVCNLSFLHWWIWVGCFSFHEFIFDLDNCLNWGPIKIDKSKTGGCRQNRGCRGVLARWSSWIHHDCRLWWWNSDCYVLGHLAHIFLSFLSDMYLYDHMTPTHMTAYLYNRAILSGTPLFPPFIHFPLFSPYGSLWPPLFVTPLFCDAYCLWPHCSPYLYA